MKINLTTILIAIILGLGIYSYIQHKKYLNQVGVTSSLMVSKDSTTRLKDSVSARLASVSIERDSLASVASAGKVLNGKPTSGAIITVTPKPVHDTTSASAPVNNGIRVAHLQDSSAQGKLDAIVTVLPLPGPIKLDWNFVVNPFKVTVGTIQLKNDEVVFVAHTPYGDTQISSPFATPVVAEDWVDGYFDGAWSMFEHQVILRAGLTTRVPFIHGWYLLGEAEQPVGKINTGRINVGLRKTFKVF